MTESNQGTDNCLFCKIVSGGIPAAVVAQNEFAIAFNDISPQAPVHVLVIPRRHVISLSDEPSPDEVVAMMQLAAEVARDAGLDSRGYRVVSNVGKEGGQSVYHLHWHVLGGRQMTWPPG